MLHTLPSLASEPPAIGRELRAILRIFGTRWWIILTAVVLSLGVGIIYTRSATPRYRTGSEVLLDPRGKGLFDREVVPTGLGSSYLGADTLLVDSQVEIILSQSVLSSVVASQELAEDSEFIGDNSLSSGSPLVRPVLNLAREILGRSEEPESPYFRFEQAITKLRKNLIVKRKGNTYFLRIEMLSVNPEKAARIANAVAETYISEGRRASKAAARSVVDALSPRLTELRADAEQIERAAEQYRSTNKLSSAGQDVTLTEQQMRSINDQLSIARGEAGTARARWEQAELLSRDPMGEIQTQALQSTELSQLRGKLSELAVREADLSSKFLENHPSVTALWREREAVKAAIYRESQRVVASLRLEYDSSVAKITSLERQLAQLEATVLQTNLANIKFRQLKRQADAAQSLYGTLLSRATEARELAGWTVDNARIISSAPVPRQPVWPAARLILGGSLAFGLVLGAMIAWVGHVLNGTPTKDHSVAPCLEPSSRSGESVSTFDEQVSNVSSDGSVLGPQGRNQQAPHRRDDKPTVLS